MVGANGKGWPVGLLVIDPEKLIIGNIQEHYKENGWDTVFATSDPRLAKALRIIGGVTLGISPIRGVETYATV